MEFINLIKTEFILDIKKIISYKVSFITDLVIFSMVLFSIFVTGLDDFFSNSFEIGLKNGKILSLIGFILWQTSITALGWTSHNISKQAQEGSLELKMQSKYPSEILFFIEMITYLLVSFVMFFFLLSVFLLAGGGNFRDLFYILISYCLSVPALIGMYGIGLILGGISLEEKQVGNLVFILQAGLAFLSDFTKVRERLFNLIPFNAGIKISRSIYLSESFENYLIYDYVLVNFIYLLLGMIIFRYFLQMVRKKGSFNNY